ncbi:MAG: hypothetical protein QGF03_06580 [SAR324 cluster bacterium]|jgi:hypothetical protein|nr:hypothetical protein [SAR324 cluster bacterium]|tara:strand:+ start:534 stop:1484 length:951 start_codon:yes stop_codon:yes gene_type:complete
MKTKSFIKLLPVVASLSIGSPLFGGPLDNSTGSYSNGFESARRPITNPTLFDLALPRTQIHAIFMHHRFPNKINSEIGAIKLGGDLQLYALQAEYALNDRFSIVALKDGYVDFNPDGALFSSEEGFANVGAGVKYAFHVDPDNQTAASVTGMYEIPIGDDDVFQGEGDGNINVTLNGLALVNNWQVAAAAGLQVPISDDFSTQGFLSGHLSYEVTPWFIPLVELNWFHVFNDGNGGTRYGSQAGGAVPAVAQFEGADLLNWGAANATDNEYVTLGLGFRSRLTPSLSIGFAYEIPLTDESDNITDDRFTLDLVWSF